MLFVIVVVVVLVAVPAFGGKFSSLAELRLRGLWWVFGALVVQTVVISVVEFDSQLIPRAVHLLSYAMIGVALWLNRRVAFMWVVTSGWALNTTVIAANGGVMPTGRGAAAELGRPPSDRFENAAVLEDPKLVFLGDVLVTPEWLPLRNAFSVGDVLLVVGLGLVVWSASRTGSSPSGSLPAGNDRQ